MNRHLANYLLHVAAEWGFYLLAVIGLIEVALAGETFLGKCGILSVFLSLCMAERMKEHSQAAKAKI